MVASAGDLPITGADLNLSCIAVRSAAVPHPIRLCPDVAVVTEVSPGAGLSVGVGGGVLTPSLTDNLHNIIPVGCTLKVSKLGAGVALCISRTTGS